METTVPRATDIPLPDPADGRRLGTAQRLRLLDEVARLTPEQWRIRTECPRWTVREMVAHVVAGTENAAHPLRGIADLVVGPLVRHRGDTAADAMNEMGIDRRRAWSADRLVADGRALVPQADPPRWFRALPLPMKTLPPHSTGATFNDILTPRDAWMHRHDIARATGTSPDADPTDADVVAQVVRDLSRVWTGPDIVLRLTGAEGGTWLLTTVPARRGRRASAGRDVAAVVELPAVDFLRHLSGRATSPDFFAGASSSVRPDLIAARVIF